MQIFLQAKPPLLSLPRLQPSKAMLACKPWRLNEQIIRTHCRLYPGRRVHRAALDPHPRRSLHRPAGFLQRMWLEPILAYPRMRVGHLPSSQLFPRGIANGTLVQPCNIHGIELNAHDVGLSSARRTFTLRTQHRSEPWKSWIIF